MQRKVSPAKFNARAVAVVGLGVMAETGRMGVEATVEIGATDAGTTVGTGGMGAGTVVEIGGMGVGTTVIIGGMGAGTIASVVAGIVAMGAVATVVETVAAIVVARSRVARPRLRLSANLISNACGVPGGHFARTPAIVRTRKAVPHSAITGGTMGGSVTTPHSRGKGLRVL